MIAITGAAGFIGRSIVAQLLQTGHVVRALLTPAESYPEAWCGRVDLHTGDIRDANAVSRLLTGADRVIHLAAVVGDWGAWADYQAITVDGTRHVLDHAAQAGVHVTLASSIVVYGEHLGGQVCHEDTPHGRAFGPYSRAKQTQEQLAEAKSATHGLRCAIVRPANVYGPGCKPWVIEAARALKRGPTLYDGGHHCAGLVYVDNVADVFVRASTQNAIGVFNASDGTTATWHSYFAGLARATNAPPPRSIPLGRWIAEPAAQVMESVWRAVGAKQRPQLTREAVNLIRSDFKIPYARAHAELGYTPHVDYETGLRAVSSFLKTEQI
jgi:2-alkyl-3-oxoalkanoate reductase